MGMFSYGEEVQERAMALQQSLTEAITSGNLQMTSDLALELVRYTYIGIAYDKYGFMAAIDLQNLFDNLSDEDKEQFKLGIMQSYFQIQTA